jgi:multicomponent Na+:H+ antiporter subunit D
LKVPYFIWFGKNNCSKETWERAAEPPWNMNVAMIVASFLCIFIGLPAFGGQFGYQLLYNLLPYQPEAADYAHHVYSSYHVSESLQILLFTALGFFLLIKKLAPEPTISIDMDWFYRKGGRVFFWLARKPIQTLVRRGLQECGSVSIDDDCQVLVLV